MPYTPPSPKPRKHHWLGRVAKVALLVSLIGTAANWQNIHMVATYNPIILAGKYETPANLTESRRQDIDYLSRLTKYDRSFNEAERGAFLDLIAQTSEDAAQLSPAAYYLAVSEAVALADNGHTNLDISPLYHEFPMVDIRLFGFADGYHIVEAAGDAQALVGHRVTEIDGRPIEEVVTSLSRFRGGNAAWRRNAAPSFMVVPSILFEAGLSNYEDRLTLTTMSRSGVIANHEIVATRTAQDAADDEWTRIARADEDERHVSMRDGRGAIETVLSKDGHYIRTPSGFGDIETFYAETLGDIAPGSLDYLVVDFRRNSGGNYSKSAQFAKQAHETLRDDGTLYLVTGSDTFSAAIVTIAMLKHYSDRKTVIIGTPMGDREHFWAERGMNFSLPNSGWRILYATGFHDWGGDCPVERYCFTRNRRYDDIAVGSLAPDVLIGETFGEHLEGRDAILEYIMNAHSPQMEALRR